MVTLPQQSGHHTTPQPRFPNQPKPREDPHQCHHPACAASQALHRQSCHYCTPVSGQQRRVGWKRRKGRLPGGTLEGGICASQEYLRKLKISISKPLKRKNICIDMLDCKEVFGTQRSYKRRSRRSKYPSYPEQRALATSGAEEQQQSNTSNSPYPSKGNLKPERKVSLTYGRNASLFLCNVFPV